MSTSFLPLLSYVLISTFTPGPSNISSAWVAVLYGYRNTLRYQIGLAAGVFLHHGAQRLDLHDAPAHLPGP